MFLPDSLTESPTYHKKKPVISEFLLEVNSKVLVQKVISYQRISCILGECVLSTEQPQTDLRVKTTMSLFILFIPGVSRSVSNIRSPSSNIEHSTLT